VLQDLNILEAMGSRDTNLILNLPIKMLLSPNTVAKYHIS
jgi:hypothetical protein